MSKKKFAKNEIESYMFRKREEIEDPKFKEDFESDQKETISQLLLNTENWLNYEADESALEDVEKKFEEIQSKFKEVSPKFIEHLEKVITSTPFLFL